MEDSEPCPFCGGKKIKKLPISDKLRKASGTGSSTGGGFEIDPNPDAEPHFKCNGCNKKYVDAERDISGITNNLKVGANIPILIRNYYHENVLASDLILKYRIAIVRKPSHILSFVSDKIVERELLICFIYKGIRTFGSFVRERDEENEIYYYHMKTLSVP